MGLSNPSEPARAPLQVMRRGLQMRMSEQHLHGAQIGPGIDQVSRESVPKRVRRHALTGQHLGHHRLEHLAHGSA